MPAASHAGLVPSLDVTTPPMAIPNHRCGESPARSAGATPEAVSSPPSTDAITSETSAKSLPPEPERPPRANPAPRRPLAQADLQAAERALLAKYKFVKTLGMGAFGTVKLAVQKSNGTQWAIKVATKAALKEKDRLERVFREVHILKLIRHPHVIRLNEVADTPDSVMLVLEYVEWGSLLDYIMDYDPVPEPVTRKFFQQLVSGVEHLHFLRVVHRDIKLDNLLVDKDYNLKIADFGLASRLTDGAFLWTSCGTPKYAAPEVVSGRLYAGPEVDVWSCGVVLYALLCGRLPFDDPNVAVLFQLIQRGSYTPPERGAPGAVALVDRMLAVDPLHRITIPEIRGSEWFRADLPVYLAASPEESLRRADPARRDPQVLEYVAKRFHVDTDVVHRLLSLDALSDVSQAYLKIADARMRRKATQLLESSPTIDGLASRDGHGSVRDACTDRTLHTPKWCPYPLRPPQLSPTAPAARPSRTAEALPPLCLGDAADAPPGPPPVGRGSRPSDLSSAPFKHAWRLGHFSKLDLPTIMLRLYALLKEENLRWKVAAQYKLHCRDLRGDEDLLAVHLYRVPTGHPASFLVELSLLHPNVLEQLDLAHRLYRRMDSLL